MELGDEVCISWNPNRKCVFSYLGDNLFEVIQSQNAKLKVDNRFFLERFTLSQPMYVTLLLPENEENVLFSMRDKGGLTGMQLIKGSKLSE